MLTLHGSSALYFVEHVQAKTPPETVRKASFFSSLGHAPRPCSLSWSSRSHFREGNSQMGFLEANSRMQVSSVGATSISVDTALDSDLGVCYKKLQLLLAACEWELADEETRRLIIVLAGENAVKRKYVFFSEVQFIPTADLATIDRLWRTHSNGKFGYSVQRKIMKRANGDCTEFFKKVGWMKSLGADSPQFTYRSFPTEFVWELSASTPEGHLPLTNALRGTQLLKSLLNHPAFEFADDELQVPSALSSSSGPPTGNLKTVQQQQQPQKKQLSVEYSF